MRDRRIREPSLPEYIYVMKNPASGFYKIGKSINPTDRLEKAKTWVVGVKLVYVSQWAFRGAGKIEAMFHVFFKPCHRDREWFMLEPVDIELIRRWCDLNHPEMEDHDRRVLQGDRRYQMERDGKDLFWSTLEADRSW